MDADSWLSRRWAGADVGDRDVAYDGQPAAHVLAEIQELGLARESASLCDYSSGGAVSDHRWSARFGMDYSTLYSDLAFWPQNDRMTVDDVRDLRMAQLLTVLSVKQVL